jgi:DNA repair exonuclease SbcCD ATPase subunit
MKKIILVILILLLPAYASAAYKIYLKNGSVIKGVSSYQEKGKEVTIYFGTGSMMLPKENILRIEHTESADSEFVPEEREEGGRQNQEKAGGAAPPAQAPEPAADRNARMDELKAQLDSVNSEIASTQEREAQLTASINEKTGSRFHYNLIQIKQLEKELGPLRQDLADVQQRKAELIKQRDDIQAELRSMGQ